LPEPVAAAAPAQPTPPPTPTATAAPTAVSHAVETRDFRKFREANRAVAQGKPLTAPAPENAAAAEPHEPAAPAAAAQPERPVSKRQQQINDYERRIAEQDRRIQELADQLRQPAAAARSAEPSPPAAPEPAPAATAPSVKDHERFMAMPDAPKVENFDSFEQWTVAMQIFVADKRFEERDAATKQEQTKERQVTAQRERQGAFNERIADARTTDPQFFDRLTPEILALKPFHALEKGERPTALNAIAEELLDSPVAPQLMLHLSEHPEELQRLGAIRDPRTLVREFARLEARFDNEAAPTKPAAPTPKTVSAAPAPPVSVGSRSTASPADPVKAAIKSRDFRAFRRANFDARRKAS
jgi:hypothetical protein